MLVKNNMSTKTKFLKIILPAVIVVFLIAGYLYLAGKTKLNNEPVEVEETNDWKTYKNEEYGFEVKYPTEWHLEEGESGMVTFVSSNVFEESSRLMVGIRMKGEDNNIGFSTGRGVDQFIQKGTVNIGGSISRQYFMLGETDTVSMVEFRNIEGGELIRVKDFEIVASLSFMYNPKIDNIEKNRDVQNSKKVLKSITLPD